MEESPRPTRYRMNVRTTKDGYPALDVTVDGQDSGRSKQEIANDLGDIVQGLIRAYPPGVSLGPETKGLQIEIESTKPVWEALGEPALKDGGKGLQEVEVVPPPDPQATNFEHSKIAHPPELCFCYGSAVADLGPICSECGCCECGCCGDLGNPQHGTKCSSYPHEAKVE